VKLLRISVNLYKVVLGVGFSLLWAWVMYLLWQQPSYITFIWFYLVIGSILLKWVLFGIIDRVHLKMRLRAVKRELDQSDMRVRQATKGEHREDDQV
jgi:hypothetical protein